MEKVKRQHYVPQFYLKQWNNEKSDCQIYVYNKELRKSFSTNIHGIASSNYFYDFPKLNEEQKVAFLEHIESDTTFTKEEKETVIKNLDVQLIENTLSKIESINSSIINSIIERLNNIKALPLNYFLNHSFIKGDELLELSHFVALQVVRTEEHRIFQNDITKWFMKVFADNIFENIDKLEHDSELIEKMGGIEEYNEFKKQVESSKFNSDSYEIEIDENFNKINHISSIFEQSETISDILIKYKWTILINNTDIPFLTTDNPVVKKANLDSIYSHGFSSKGIEIFYPISPNYAISIMESTFFKEIALDLFNQTILEIKKENVIHYNDLLIQNATTQIYSNINNFEWVEKRINETPIIADKGRKRIGSFK